MATSDASKGVLSRQAVATLAALLIGIGLIEVWALSSLYGADHFAGPLIGAAVAFALCTAPLLMGRTSKPWAIGVMAAMTAVLELTLGLAAIVSVSALAVMVMPEPVLVRMTDSEWGTELSVFTIIGLAILVSARGWLKYTAQTRRMVQATLDAERARAQVAEQERELARSELTVLKAQIEPHFLWNTLAHVQHLARKSPADAEAMTGHLIRFLRTSIPNSRSNRTTLGSEIESAGAYLELMKMRMGNRLSVHVDIDPRLAEVSFPPMLVQTLVENAIKHGIEPKVGAARVEVTATIQAVHQGHPDDEEMVVVEVRDDGVGLMASPATAGTGMGLRNVRDRLRLIYGSEAALRISGRPEGGVVVRVEVPLSHAYSASGATT